MADKSRRLILEALGRAVLEPEGLPLHSHKSAPGLFPSTALARQAAQRCKAEALVRVVGSHAMGKQLQETCAITDKGLAFLLREADPRQILEDFVRALEGRQAQFAELVHEVQRAGCSLQALKTATQQALEQLLTQSAAAPVSSASAGKGTSTWPTHILKRLACWQGVGASEDYPLPVLYRDLYADGLPLSIGQFHDGLRSLYQDDQIYLHPWTGPLQDVPEPSLALLIGHEVAYYASLRRDYDAIRTTPEKGSDPLEF